MIRTDKLLNHVKQDILSFVVSMFEENKVAKNQTDVSNYIKESIADGYRYDIFFQDDQKTIPHGLIVYRLDAFGITQKCDISFILIRESFDKEDMLISMNEFFTKVEHVVRDIKKRICLIEYRMSIDPWDEGLRHILTHSGFSPSPADGGKILYTKRA